jgi:TrmH family RNA methyltransferase
MAAGEEVVRSRANPLFQRLRALKERGAERDLCLLEGPKVVEEALAAHVEVAEAAAAPEVEASPRGAAVLAALRAQGVPVRRLHARLVASLSEAETSQGLLALARRPRFDEAILFRANPLVLVAVGVQNPGNLGGLLRTAEAAGATGAYLAEGCADPFSWKALRGSMGSAFRFPHVRGGPAEALLDGLEARGVALLATAADGERLYDEVDLTRPVALLFGSEGKGLPSPLARRAATCLRIPVAPPVESLNVGVAAGILLFEAARQRRSRCPAPVG